MTARRAASELLQRDGLATLYRGVSTSVARAAVVSATRFSTFQAVLHLLAQTS